MALMSTVTATIYRKENPERKPGPTEKRFGMGQVPHPVKPNPVTEASTTNNQSIHLGEEGSPSQRLMTQGS